MQQRVVVAHAHAHRLAVERERDCRLRACTRLQVGAHLIEDERIVISTLDAAARHWPAAWHMDRVADDCHSGAM